LPEIKKCLSVRRNDVLLFRVTVLCISRYSLHQEFLYTSLTTTSVMNSIEQISAHRCLGYVCIACN